MIILKWNQLEIPRITTRIAPPIIIIIINYRKYVSNIPGKHEAKELQKTAVLGTAHTLRKVLM